MITPLRDPRPAKDDSTIVERLRPTTVELLKHLSLLFVPAGVGVMIHVARIGREWLPIASETAMKTIGTHG